MGRALNELSDEMELDARALLSLAEGEGLSLLLYCTGRTPEEQARLYRTGRPLARILEMAEELSNTWDRADLAEILVGVGPQLGERILTWAGPGQSAHQYGAAWDAVPMRDGKPVWGATDPDDLPLWISYGRLVEAVGCNWAGTWSDGRREYPHAQHPRFNWREWIR